MLIVGRGSSPQLRDLFAASTLASPNSVILPSLMTFSTRLRFESDQRLPFRLGVNFLQ